MTQTHVTDLIAAYSLSCLDAGDRQQVETHLAGCPVCQAELRAYQQVTTDLSLAAGQVAPPQHLKKVILRKAASPAHSGQPQGLMARLHQLVQVVRPVWTAISLILIIGLAVSTFAFWRQAQQLPASHLEHFQVVTLKSPDKASDVTAVLLISENGQFGTLVTDGLEPLGKSQQYQLWLIKGGSRSSGGVFSVNQEGYAAMEIHSAVPLVEFDAFGVTIEPAGGSPGPTGRKVLGSS